MKQLLPYLLIGALLPISACQKEADYEAIDMGYEYFPNRVGAYIEYEVDSIHYGITVDTTQFFLREIIAEEFIDQEGNLAFQVERYKKFSMDAEYELTDVWVQLRTSTTGERIEENQRFVRMVFPLDAEARWDGNAYNTLDEWTHSYSSIGSSYSLPPLSFSDVVRIQQRDNVNLVDQEEAWEVYARGVGLIHKRFKDLEFQNFEITGVDMEMKAIAYGAIQ